jgi:hypothetical protein
MFTGVIVLAAGGFFLYAKNNVVSSSGLSKKIVAAVEREDVRRFIAQKTSAELVRRVPDLESSSDEVQSVTNKVVETDQFKAILGAAVVAADDRLVDQEQDKTSMKLQNVGKLIHDQLETVDPDLADQIPTDLDAKIADLGGVPELNATVRFLRTIRWLGTLLPPIGILLLIASVLVAADRRVAVGRLGVSLAITAAVLIVLSFATRAVVLNQVPDGIDRDAAGGVWDEVIGPFRTWLIVAGLLGLLLVAGAAAARRIGDRNEDRDEDYGYRRYS